MDEKVKAPAALVSEDFEKRPWSSKKFAFAMTQVIFWKVIILTALVLFTIFAEISVLACIITCLLVVTPGVIEVQYLGGQKALDQYVRLASLTAGQITDGGKDLLNKVDNALGLDLIEDAPKAEIAAPASPETEPEPKPDWETDDARPSEDPDGESSDLAEQPPEKGGSAPST